MSPITTHVLDTALGKPAESVAVTLYRVEADGQTIEIAQGVTNADGRVADLLPESAAAAGTYRLEFDTAGYFQQSGRATFYPLVSILFETTSSREHFHVPLLLSPFGYTTYRGS